MTSQTELVAKAIICSANPISYDGGLPTSYQGELVCQRALASLNLAVPTGIPATAAIIVNYARGYNFYVLMNVPEGFTALNTSSAVVAPGYTVAQVGNLVTFSITSGGLLSTNFAHPAGTIDVEPQLQSIVSVGRVASAIIRVKSSTTSVTAAALSGTLAGVGFADIRSCYTLSPTNIATSAMTPKDALLNVKAYDGITAVIGPDVIPGVKPISYSYVSQTKEYALGAPFPFGTPIYSMFLSPFANAAMSVGLGNDSLPVTSTLVTADRQFWLGSRLTVYAFNSASFNTTYGVAAQPFYYSTSTTTAGQVLTYALPVRRQAVPITTSTSAAGEYIFEVEDPPVGFGFFGWLVWTSQTGPGAFGIAGYREDIPNLYDPSNIGALRAIRWDSLGTGTTLSIEVREVVEAVPSGQITKVLTQQPEVGVGNANAMTMLRLMYGDCECPLARVYVDSVYQAIIADPARWVMSRDTAALLGGATARNPNPPVASAIELTRERGLGAMALCQRYEEQEDKQGRGDMVTGTYGSATGMYGTATGMYGTATGKSSSRKRQRIGGGSGSPLVNILGALGNAAIQAFPAVLSAL